MAPKVQSQVRALAKAVAHAFTLANLTPQERTPTHHLELPWAVPPLTTTAKLGDAALQDYFDSPLTFDLPLLVAFWKKTLDDMWHVPGSIIKNGTYAALGRPLKMTKLGQRVFRFAQPPGYGEGLLDLTAGLQLSLEVAHTVLISVPVKNHVVGLSDYWVETADGTQLGVRDGRPIIDSPWDYDGSGQILDMLEMSRGPTTYTMLYDPISMLRTTLHNHREKFRRDFAGLDLALQALRYLSWGTFCPDLVSAIQTEPTNVDAWRGKEQALWDAKEVMEAKMSDRQRLQTLEALLVPDVMGITRFRREFFSTDRYPFTLAPGRADQIKQRLHNIYETEVPCNLRRNRP